jgi:glycosyltransferase involved in cell wall biosynthesis
LISQDVLAWVEDPLRRQEVTDAYGLVAPYVFYPAQFWAHKNHRYIVAALNEMRKRYGWCPQAVFCGGDRGTLQATLEYAQTLGVRDKIIYCGFVPSADIPYLYTGALALVMPTYFGPTNIPPVEAASLGVPVCYSDLPSFREQMADRASYVDLTRPGSLADTLETLRREPPKHTGASPSSFAGRDDEYADVLRRIIAKFRQKVIDPMAAN